MIRIFGAIAVIVLFLSVPVRAQGTVGIPMSVADTIKRADISPAHAQRVRTAEADSKNPSGLIVGILLIGLFIGSVVLVSAPGGSSDRPGRLNDTIRRQ